LATHNHQFNKIKSWGKYNYTFGFWSFIFFWM